MLVGERTAASLREWLLGLGSWDRPLFVRVHRTRESHDLGHLSGEGIHLLVRTRARQVGCKAACRPHSMRHASATEAARRGSLAELQALGAAANCLNNGQDRRLRAIGLVR